MTRKFKSTITDWVAIQAMSGFDNVIRYYDLYNAKGDFEGRISCRMVENSNEWEEITSPELVEGRWYKQQYLVGRWDGEYAFDGSLILRDSVNIEDGVFIGYSEILNPKRAKEAFPEEIHRALDAIRKHKGLVKGVKVCDLGGEKYIVSSKLYYDENEDVLFADADKGYSVCLYQKGQWVEKVEEPILVTEDGYKIFSESGQIWFVLFNPEDSEYAMVKASCSTMQYPKFKKSFYYKKNAQAYIERHKPKYSDEDVEWAVEEGCKRFHAAYKIGVANKNDITRLVVEKLKNSKND